MRPASYDLRLQRDGTPFLGVILHGKDPRTGQVVRLPVPGVTIEWAIEWPDGPEVRTQFSAPDLLLTIDPRTGAIVYPVSAERKAALEGAVEPITMRIRAIMPDGFAIPFLAGTITVED